MKTICVTGASGCLGQALLQELQGKYRTKALFRSASEISRHWRSQGCEVSLGGLADDAALAELVQGADAVLRCAATMAKHDYERSYAVNVLGTKRLAQHAAAARCGLFVHVSSISVYAATCTPDNVYTEESVPQNIDQLNHYSRTKYFSELAQNIPIRPRGGMGSKNKNFHTAGISLDLGALNELISIDGDLVTVQAGMKLSQLFQILKANGLALPSLGEWAGVTVAGAVSTGTHGGSVHYGSMSSSLHAMKLVLADGTLRLIHREDELFDYVGISFGIFGIISEVTLRCVPHFRLHLEKEIVSLAKFIHSLDEVNRRWRYLSAIWIPSAGNVLLYKAQPTEANKTGGKREQRFNLKNDSICMMCNRLPLPGLFPEKLFQESIVGDWDEILAPIGEDGRVSGYLKDNLKRPLEVEIAVPLANAACLLLELDKLFQAHRAFPSLPVGVRCGGKEDFLLSPCYKRDSLWLAFFMQNNARLLEQISNLVMNHHCRAHWGKSMWLREEYLKTQYERWNDILETKRQLDPEAIFSNAFTRRFGI